MTQRIDCEHLVLTSLSMAGAVVMKPCGCCMDEEHLLTNYLISVKCIPIFHS